MENMCMLHNSSFMLWRYRDCDLGLVDFLMLKHVKVDLKWKNIWHLCFRGSQAKKVGNHYFSESRKELLRLQWRIDTVIEGQLSWLRGDMLKHRPSVD